MTYLSFDILVRYVEKTLPPNQLAEVAQIIADTDIYDDEVKGIKAIIANKPEGIDTIDYIDSISSAIHNSVIAQPISEEKLESIEEDAVIW